MFIGLIYFFKFKSSYFDFQRQLRSAVTETFISRPLANPHARDRLLDVLYMAAQDRTPGHFSELFAECGIHDICENTKKEYTI